MKQQQYKIAIINLGCPKNLVDAEQIITRLKSHGYEITDDYQNANLVIINTCGFINEAIQESLDTINNTLKTNPNVIVAGCLGAKKNLIVRANPCIRPLKIIGPNSCDEIIKTVQQHLPLTQHLIIPESIIKLTPPHYAYIKISEGCNQNCSYCIIPQLRGKLVSRPLKDIMHEAEQLVTNGVKELIIISQDTGAYGTDLGKNQFLPLIQELGQLGIWVRLHYLYPYPHLDQVLPLMAQHKILPYLDVPLQHVNNRILKLMQRPGYDDVRVDRWRDICPDLTIRSTFIVGFPGETDAEFQELLDFLEAAQLDRVGCFKYSAVAGAKANDLPDQIHEDIKEERWHQLMQLQQKISAQKLQTKIGQTMQVLIDDIKDNTAIARSMGDAPEIDGQIFIENAKQLTIGDFATVTITAADDYDLWGI